MSPSQLRPPPPGSRRSLVAASLDIGRVLADRDGVTFRAQGTCMYPTVRPGDVLRIRSCAAADVTVGDIAVCRTPAYLFSHRVIETGAEGGRAYVVTRPDRSAHGSDAPTFDDDLLGVVVSIERGGVPVPLQPTPYSWMARSYLSARLALVDAGRRARMWLVSAVAQVQGLQLYRSVSHRWFAPARSTPEFTIRVPVNATLGDAVVREFELGEFDPATPSNGRALEWWTLTAFVRGVKEAAGSITATHSLDGAWQLEKPSVRIRYRGTGLEDMLVREAEAILERGDGSTQGAGR